MFHSRIIDIRLKVWFLWSLKLIPINQDTKQINDSTKSEIEQLEEQAQKTTLASLEQFR